LSTTSRNLIDPSSAATAQPARPAKTLSGIPGEILQDIAHTREKLADTMEALAHKVDLPTRLKGKVHDTKETMQDKVEKVRRYLHKGTETLQGKADEAAWQAKSLTNQSVAKLPPPVAGRIEQLMKTVRQRPVPAAALVLGVLFVLRGLLRRSR